MSSSIHLAQAIKQDHRAILSLQHTDNVKQLYELIWNIIRHAIAEELVLHPLYEEHLKDGKQIAEHDRREHQALKDPLLQLPGLEPAERTLRLAEIINTLSVHFAEEEQGDLPRLEDTISEAVSIDAASRFLQLLRITKPPYPTLDDLLSAPTDKIKAELAKSLSGTTERRAAVETKN